MSEAWREALPLPHPWAWALAACGLAAALEGVLSGTGVKRRFAELRLPRLTPPLWAWTVLGISYYVLFFLLVRSLLDRPATPGWTPAALVLVTLLLAANAGWNWLFFRRKDLWISFVAFVPYVLAALALALTLWRLHSPLLPWVLLYVAYLAYATWWGGSVWRLNRTSPPFGQPRP